ncbi:MAG: hypothetical protein KGY54_09580 [Oleiphilaceae bacterium]|nr:hypothetical protein [Oleiphilaceae bacterium]
MDPVLLGAHLKSMTTEARKRGFGQIRIMVVFRRQDQWLASKYAQRSDRIAGASQNQFEERIDYYLRQSRGYYADGLILDYDFLYEEICRAIGAANALLLPYELLKAEPVKFLNLMCDFISPGDSQVRELISSIGLRAASKKTNVRSQGSSEWALRKPKTNASPQHLSETLSRMFLRAGHPPGSIRLTPDLTQKILATYRQSNASLGEKLDLDLGAFGYFG